MYLTKAFSHSILECNSLLIAISLLTVDIISQKPPFFNILRLFLTCITNFINKSKKISRLNRLIYCEMIFTLFSSNSLVSINTSGSTKTHYGAYSQNRTDDLILTMDALYLLSYEGTFINLHNLEYFLLSFF